VIERDLVTGLPELEDPHLPETSTAKFAQVSPREEELARLE